MNIKKPEGSTIFISIIFYIVLLTCIELKIVKRIKSYFTENQAERTSHESIKLFNISKNYGDIQALQNVSYEAN